MKFVSSGIFSVFKLFFLSQNKIIIRNCGKFLRYKRTVDVSENPSISESCQFVCPSSFPPLRVDFSVKTFPSPTRAPFFHQSCVQNQNNKCEAAHTRDESSHVVVWDLMLRRELFSFSCLCRRDSIKIFDFISECQHEKLLESYQNQAEAFKWTCRDKNSHLWLLICSPLCELVLVEKLDFRKRWNEVKKRKMKCGNFWLCIVGQRVKANAKKRAKF